MGSNPAILTAVGSNPAILTAVGSNPVKDFGFFHVRKFNPASLWNVGGSAQVPAHARSNGNPH